MLYNDFTRELTRILIKKGLIMKYGFYKMEDFDSPVNYCLSIKKHNNKRSETLDYVYFYNISDLKQYCVDHSIIIINKFIGN